MNSTAMQLRCKAQDARDSALSLDRRGLHNLAAVKAARADALDAQADAMDRKEGNG